MDSGQDGMPEEKGIVEQIKHRKLSKYCHWKRRSDSVVLATIEGEIEGKCFPGRRRTAWIDDFGGGQTMTWTWQEQMQWKEDTTAGSRMSTGLRHTNNNMWAQLPLPRLWSAGSRTQLIARAYSRCPDFMGRLTSDRTPIATLLVPTLCVHASPVTDVLLLVREVSSARERKLNALSHAVINSTRKRVCNVCIDVGRRACYDVIINCRAVDQHTDNCCHQSHESLIIIVPRCSRNVA